MELPLPQPDTLSRRDAIRKTLMFSTALLTAGWASRLAAQAPATSFPDRGIHLLAVGDFGTANAAQFTVAARMAEFARQLKAPLTGILALGDNFYGKLEPARFVPHFEEMYTARDFACPFYAILGNHDYGPGYDSRQGPPKAQMQLDYALGNPASRWKMPAKWYAVELPDAKNPLVKLICLDTNYFEGALTPQEKLDQQRFLEAELAKKTRAPWLWVAGHHPLFSNGQHGDDAGLIKRFGGYLADSGVSMYFCGHDHTLQHLELPDYKASFIVSGGGGAGSHKITRADRAEYAGSILGFTHLHVTPSGVDVQHIDTEGRCLHAFRRTPDGKVKVKSDATAVG